MNLVASATLLLTTSRFAVTTSSQVDTPFFRSDSGLSSASHLVFTAVPLLAAFISSEDILATPTDTARPSWSRTTTSSPGSIPSLHPVTPTANVLAFLSRTASAAPGSILTQPLVTLDSIRDAVTPLGRNFSPRDTSKRTAPTTCPSMITSSIRSMSGALLSRTSLPVGMASSPHPAPNCESIRERMLTVSSSKAGLASPGGVSLTSLVLPPHLPHSLCSSTGTLHASHHRRWILPSLTAVTANPPRSTA